ncbi:hypothetical protein Taro_022076 [Colocasia esculenta]|uniref:Uncharacterized protein n=1 Tax=Colocasia esculenta TaxID=4460 RepID=A0A843V0Q0_COLES|nr:hypothetical protein [Colocasia esculenta]
MNDIVLKSSLCAPFRNDYGGFGENNSLEFFKVNLGPVIYVQRREADLLLWKEILGTLLHGLEIANVYSLLQFCLFLFYSSPVSKLNDLEEIFDVSMVILSSKMTYM